MKRRSLLKAMSVSGVAATIPTIFTNFLIENGRTGVMVDLFRLAGVENLLINQPNNFQDLDKALASLKNKEIDVLITSPFYLIKSNPDLSLMGHFPMDLSHDLKKQWVQDNYKHVNDVYSKMGLSSQYVGMMSSQMVRMTNLNEEQLANYETTKPVIGANGQRALWYEKVGFKPVNGVNEDKAHYQVIMLRDNRINITEAHSPLLLLNSIQHNTRRIQMDFYHKHNIISDNKTRRGLSLEVVYHADSNPEKVRAAIEKVNEYLAFEQKAQVEAFAMLQQLFKKNIISNLPESALNKLADCKKSYLDVLSSHSSVAAKLTASYKAIG
jgi:hypothetical protein